MRTGLNMDKEPALLIPSRGVHAIQQVTIAVEFASRLSPDALGAFIKYYDDNLDLKNWFPRKLEEQTTSFKADKRGIKVIAPSSLGGIVLERIAPDGTVEWSLTLKPDMAFVVCTNYTRWKEIAEKALTLLKTALAVLPESLAIKVAGLRYVDEFYWNGDKKAFRADMVFDRSSPNLPASVFERAGIWHVHSGWFKEEAEPFPCQILTNVNVSVLDQPTRLVTQLVTLHKAAIRAPIARSKFEELQPLYERLHQDNKGELGLLLNREVSELISLETRHALH